MVRLNWRKSGAALLLSGFLGSCSALPDGMVVEPVAVTASQVPVFQIRKPRPGEPDAPIARIKPSVLIAAHGANREDAYFWLANRKDTDVARYLEAENKYAVAMMDHTSSLQDTLRSEIRAHIPPEHETPAYKMGGYYYFERYAPGADYYTLSRRQGSKESPEETVADFQSIAQKHQQFLLKKYATSPDGSLFAYSVDHEGDRLHTVYFKDMKSGQMSPDQLKFVAEDIAIAADNKSVYYIKLQRGSLRSAEVMRHTLGGEQKDDASVFDETDETFSLTLRASKGGRYIIVTSEHTLTTEELLIDTANPTAPPKIIRPRQRGIQYYSEEVGGKLYLRTNLNAPDFKIVRAAPGNFAQWSDVVPHARGVFIDGFDVTTNYVAVDEHVRGATRIRVGSFKSGKDVTVPVEDQVYASFSDDWRFPSVRNADPDADTLRFATSSMIKPVAIYDYNVRTGKVTNVQRAIIPGYDSSLYEVKRLFAAAPGGQLIPVTLSYRKDRRLPGGNPILIRGYGAYGINYDAVFNERTPVLLDRGFIVAHAHVRGGREMGQAWYEGGKLRNKKNTFADFIVATEHLIKEGYADPAAVLAEGRSAGGLLIGAVANMRPDLYRGMIADVPFVDVVTTMLDTGIPLTTLEYDEWGNPEEAGDYRFLLDYSPYDNVTRKDYPAMLVTAGYNDTQVGYFEPAKWVAKMRVTRTDQNPLIFRTNMGAGHSGDSGRFGEVDKAAFSAAFLIDLAAKAKSEKPQASVKAAE